MSQTQSRKMVRVGFVGAGLIAAEHLISMSQWSGLELSVFDADTQRAKALADRFNLVIRDTLKELIEGCDLVWVCAPPFAHRAVIAESVRMGKAIFCEKPLAANSDDVLAIARMVRRAGVPFYMGQSGRWTEPFALMKKIAQQGAIGEIVRVWSRRLGYLDAKLAPSWRLNEQQSGGAIVELGVHEIDFMQWIAAPFKRVTAHGQRLIKPDYLDTVVATGETEHGTIGYMELCWSSPRYLFQRGIEGSKGSLFFDDARFRDVELHRVGKPVKVLRTKNDWRDPQTLENFTLRDQDKSVLQAYRQGKPYPVTLEVGARAVLAAVAMRQSTTTNRAQFVKDVL